MSTLDEALVLDTPGVYAIPPHLYHQDPVPGGSLSSTVARMLVQPGGPAKWKHGVRRESRTLDFGSLAHLKLLGAGERLRIIDAADFKTKAAREERDAAYAAGEVPVCSGSDDLARADAMVAAAHDDPIVRMVLEQTGRPEQTVVWQEAGVWCRAMIDFLPEAPGTPFDYKTAKSAERDAFTTSALRLGYHQQVDFYLRGLRAVGLADTDTRLLLVAQEKDPPYLPNVIDLLLDHDVARVARELNDQAIATWARCRETGVWPGYDIDPTKPPRVPGWWLYELDDTPELKL